MEYIGYLCGSFSLREGRVKTAARLPSRWRELRLSETELHEYGQYYLPDFVRFCLNPDAGEDVAMQRFPPPWSAAATTSASGCPR